MSLIFFFSSQPATESSKTSGTVITTVLSVVYPDFNTLSKEEQDDLVSSLQDVVRTGAHFAIYFVLGLLSILMLITYNSPPLFAKGIISFLISGLYALSDEYHQTFADGRAFEYKDIIIDCLGALLAILLVILIAKLKKRNKNEDRIKVNKKDLLKKTEELFNKCEYYLAENNALREEIKHLKDEITALKETPKEITPECMPVCVPEKPEFKEDTPINEIAETKTVPVKEIDVKLSDIEKFGAKIIGKVVLSSVEHCNEITKKGQTSQTKELVNLILGKSEVVKAEILEIISSDANDETKKALLVSKQNETEDYFKSVEAQI